MSSFVSDNDRRHSIVLVEGATLFPDWSLIYRHNVVSTDHHISHFDAIGPNFRLFPRFQPRELKTEWHYIVSIQLFQLLPSGSGFYNLHAF